MQKPETELSINRLSDALRTSFEWIVRRDLARAHATTWPASGRFFFRKLKL
ncbi:hypothetical protein [Roseovarius sp.]|uniref:hypothetical protein n=1 Tax=Roseovarius sp. TaxID=1486281 RepID=UPI002615DB57|nr:hypothetical protein [Roseovarius sp.]